MFRGPGEFDPSTRGVYSAASSTLSPSPATTAGSIATTRPYLDTRQFSWIDSYLSVLGRETRIRGPYLRRESLFVENRVHEVFLKVEDIRKYCLLVENLFEGDKREKAREEIMNIVKDKNRGFRPEKIQTVGIGLKTRKGLGKIADEEAGLIYLANFIDYIVLWQDRLDFASIELDLISSDAVAGRYAVKLGGEGRISLLEIEKADSYAYHVPESSKFLYVASPLLLRTGKDVIGQIKEEMSKMGVKNVKIYGRVGLLGAGYSEIRRRRKPIYQALLPGSVIILDREIGDSRKIYEEGIGIGREIGFGTVLPVGGGEG